MNIVLMTNKSPVKRVGKELTTLSTVTGTIRGSTSIKEPEFDISGASISDISKVNYIYVPDFGRYYFIKDPVAVRTGIWRLTCRVDVLNSFEAGIRAQQCVIARQEKKYNLNMDDGTLKVYNNPKITTHPFPKGFNTQSFVLVVAGGK